MLAFYRNLAKLTRVASKLAGKKGTDLPGKVLRKVDDNVLTKLANNFEIINTNNCYSKVKALPLILIFFLLLLTYKEK